LAVIPFDSESEAVEIANDTDYGLAAGLWTADVSRALTAGAALVGGGSSFVNDMEEMVESTTLR
jgi:aldehyde dehydrogenase (NAD+)